MKKRGPSTGTIAFFELQGSLGLYERANLANDPATSPDAPSSTKFSLGYMVTTKEDVDILHYRAEAAGATFTESVHERS